MDDFPSNPIQRLIGLQPPSPTANLIELFGSSTVPEQQTPTGNSIQHIASPTGIIPRLFDLLPPAPGQQSASTVSLFTSTTDQQMPTHLQHIAPLAGTVPSFPIPLPPSAPAKASFSRIRSARERFEKRLRQLREVLPIGSGRVVPDTDDLTIGDARRLKTVSVLFLDICKFSSINSGDDIQQDRAFMILSLFMTEMLHIVRDYDGHFEKNTGDGLMAYFDGPEVECTQRAVDAAVTMHCYNEQVISPNLLQGGLPAIKFRVGIETGMVTFARIGVRGDHNSLVAVGNTPNIACKLMTLIPEGGVVLGNAARYRLPDDWKNQTTPSEPLDGYVITGTNIPYPAWILTYRVPNASWAEAAASILGGYGGLGGKGSIPEGLGGK